MKKVKEWKETYAHQFVFGADNEILIRLKDKKIFLLNYGYNAMGYTNGASIFLDDAHPDMIHVNYDLFSHVGKFITGGKVKINDVEIYVSSEGKTYLRIKPLEHR